MTNYYAVDARITFHETVRVPRESLRRAMPCVVHSCAKSQYSKFQPRIKGSNLSLTEGYQMHPSCV